MAFEDLKDKLQDQFAELKNRLEESPAYNSLRERYENLSPNAQRGLLLGVSAALFLFFCYIPYSYFSASGVSVAEFNEKRSLIRQLLRASRLAMQAGSVQNPPDISSLQASISGRLASFNLLPEQNGGVSPIDRASLGGSLAPPGITQEGLAVNLKQLNLKQVVDIGYNLQTLAQGVRLIGLNMVPTQKDPRYFDVVYQIVRYSMPGVGSEPAGGGANIPPPSTGRGGGTNAAPPPGSPRPRFNPPPQNNGSGQPINDPPPDENFNPDEMPMNPDEELGDPEEFEGG